MPAGQDNNDRRRFFECVDFLGPLSDNPRNTLVMGAGLHTIRALYEVPRYLVLPNFFSRTMTGELLNFALSNQSGFEQTTVGKNKGEVKLTVRKSVGIRELGCLRHDIEVRLRTLVPEFIVSLAINEFRLSTTEIQLVAHGDGAFYHRHIDTFTGEAALDQRPQRMISGVYYFNSEPRGFSGGELRLYALAGEAPKFVDIESEHNSLVVFPSWVPHEVRPVSCPSGRFIDSRFAINCWFCRTTP